MMKKLVMSLAALFLLGTAVFAQSQEEINASKLIEYTNAVIDCSNRFNYKYKSYQTFIGNVEKAYTKYSAQYTPGEKIYIGGIEGLELVYNFWNDYDAALADLPDDVPGKAEVLAAMNNARELTASLNETAQTAKAYYENAEFTEDNFEKGRTLLAELQSGYDQMKSAWETAVQLASAEGEKAEVLLLKDSPEAKYILAMKSDIAAMSDLIDDLYNMEEDDDNYTPLIERNNALKATLEEHLAMAEGVQLSEVKSIGKFRAFYSHMQGCQKSLGQALEELDKEEPRYGNVRSHLNTVNTLYNAAIGSYNDF